MNKALYWSPRILSIMYILFISMFALDVFSEGYKLNELILALLIHLIPGFLIILVTFIAWKKELIGGILFLFTSLSFTIFFNTSGEIISFLIINLPLLIIGVLFLIPPVFMKDKN